MCLPAELTFPPYKIVENETFPWLMYQNFTHILRYFLILFVFPIILISLFFILFIYLFFVKRNALGYIMQMQDLIGGK
jgi:hypothetical protein